MLLMLVLAGLTGCVNVPTVGPIELVEGEQPECQNCVRVDVSPPQPGDDPSEIVKGYLLATSNYQPDYTTAKQFLTRAAAETWNSDVTRIYRGNPQQVRDNVVKLDGELIGVLSKDRTYSPDYRDLELSFGLVQENGEWRIDKPPPGLLVEVTYFQSFYRAYQLYFIGKSAVGDGGALVPDTIYLPTLGNPAIVASALMKALLAGPSSWLAPAVTSAIPPDTTLSMESVTITDGIAEVRLSETLLALSEPKRTLLAAQIVYTLKQAGGVRSVLITVNGQPYQVPESDRNGLAVPVEAVPQALEPVPFVADDQVYAAIGDQVKLVNDSANPPTFTAMNGELGTGQYAIDSLAVSATGTDVAVVTDGRTVLRRGPTGTGKMTPLNLPGVSDLLPPQITRFGEVWVVGKKGGQQRIWLFTPTSDEIVPVAAEVLAEGDITAFHISPDGSRMAMVRTVPGGSQLGLATIIRTEEVRVDDYRPITSPQSEAVRVAQIADIAWSDATELMVLGAPTIQDNLVAMRIRDDGSRSTATTGAPSDWDARDITVQMRTKTAIVRGADDQTWRYDGGDWVDFIDQEITAIAYPG
jgi:hypothetical protein